MDSNEMHKLTEGIYKGLVEDFNPGTRHLIGMGKNYLRAISGMVEASRAYYDGLGKIGAYAKMCKGATRDIGDTIVAIVEYYKNLSEQYESLLTMFHTEVISKFEANIEQDARGITLEQKKYRENHKNKLEPIEKIKNNIKKHRKKNRGKIYFEEKDRQYMNELNKAKDHIDNTRVQGLKLAMLQERKRYCYVLDRNLALLKKHVAVNTSFNHAYTEHLDGWAEYAKNPEILPPASAALLQLQTSDIPDSLSMNTISTISEYHHGVAPPYGDSSSPTGFEDADAGRQAGENGGTLPSNQQQQQRFSPTEKRNSDHHQMPNLSELQTDVPTKPLKRVRALYSYISSGAHQLSFNEADVITLIVEKKDGWHYGENQRTNKFGWFPIVYTEFVDKVDKPTAISGQRAMDDADLARIAGGSGVSADARPKSMYGSGLVSMVNSPARLREDLNQRRMISSHSAEQPYHLYDAGTLPASNAPSDGDFINPYELNKPEHDDFDDVVPGIAPPSMRRPHSPPSGQYVSPTESPGGHYMHSMMSRSTGDGNWLMSPPGVDDSNIPRSPPADYRDDVGPNVGSNGTGNPQRTPERTHDLW